MTKRKEFCIDTIAAVSTAQGKGAISIIRISGTLAFAIAKRLFKTKVRFDDISSHTINYGVIIDYKNQEVIDEVLVSKMSAPLTFTREDVVEINCHASVVVVRRILELIIQLGARIAEPGEFTKRAFLNGRIDLSQAEAVVDMINSKTELSSKAAVQQIRGLLSQKIKKIRDKLIGLIAHIEAVIEYPEYDIPDITSTKIFDEIFKIRFEINLLIKSFNRGRVIRDGAKVVIIGRPNVGKSSLLNKLTGKEKAIVTDIPGTTRDLVEEYIDINGVPIKIIDTAGIRETDDVIERIGVQKTCEIVEDAELVIVMLDSAVGVSEADVEILEKVNCKHVIVVLNKIDLVKDFEIERIINQLNGYEILKLSVTLEVGFEQLEHEITNFFLNSADIDNQEVLVTNIRHKYLLDEAITCIDTVIDSKDLDIPVDLLSIDIKNAAECLGKIIGEAVDEDVLNKIFEKFCIGK